MFNVISSFFANAGLVISSLFISITGSPEKIEVPVQTEVVTEVQQREQNEVELETKSEIKTETKLEVKPSINLSEPTKTLLEELPSMIATVRSEPTTPIVEPVKEEVKEPEVPKLSKEEIRKKELMIEIESVNKEIEDLTNRIEKQKDLVRNQIGQSQLQASNSLQAIEVKYGDEAHALDIKLELLFEEYNSLLNY